MALQPPRVFNGHAAAVTGVTFSPDGKHLATTSLDKTVKIWDAATGQLVLSVPVGSVTFKVAYSPDGKALVVGAEQAGDSTIQILNPATGKEVRSLLGYGRDIRGLAFNPTGNRLASVAGPVGDSGSTGLRIWDMNSSKQDSALSLSEEQNRPFLGVAISPDGKHLAIAVGDWFGKKGEVKICAAATGQVVLTYRGHNGEVTAVAYSKNGKFLASGSGDKTVKLRDGSNGQELFTLTGHTEALLAIAFSPDSKLLVSASADQTLKVWDTATGKEIATLRGHAKSVTGIAFSPEGGQLASSSEDQTVRVWNLTPFRTIVPKTDGKKP